MKKLPKLPNQIDKYLLNKTQKLSLQRILIIGCGGVGKSTLSKQLAPVLDLPIIHLDQHFWNPNWVATPSVIWEQKIDQLIQGEKWIMDGNYGGTLAQRIERADTIIFLDTSILLRIFRVLKRTWKYYGKPRPDLTDNCPEKFSFQFLHYIVFYDFTRKQKILNLLQSNQNKMAVFHLYGTKEVDRFVQVLKNEK